MKRSSTTHCENCGATLAGTYCHECGQRAVELRRPVIGLVQDVIVETLSIDSKLFRTLRRLILAPGGLARDYLRGQRARYTPPFRLYLFTSVITFFVVFWGVGQPNGQGAEQGADGPSAVIMIEPDREAGAPSDEAGDAPEAIDLAEAEWEDVNYQGPAWLEPILIRMFENAKTLQSDPRLFLANARSTLPRILLALPLLYAALLTLLYFYRRRVYLYDHLIVSLYMHAALYAYVLLFTLGAFLPYVGGPLLAAVFVWATAQSYLALRQAYGSNWFSVALKGTLINSVYWIGALALVSVGVAYSLYQS